MPARIYDIAKKLGIESKDVLFKAKQLGITAARFPSSSLDKLTAEYLEEQLLLWNSPPPIPLPEIEVPEISIGREEPIVILPPVLPPPPPEIDSDELQRKLKESEGRIARGERIIEKLSSENRNLRNRIATLNRQVSEPMSLIGQKLQFAPQTIIVDGANVMWSYDNANPVPSLAVLLTTLIALCIRSISFHCFFDASIDRSLKEQSKAEYPIYKELLKRHAMTFTQVNRNADADLFILDMADEKGCRILSNDGFRDYESTYPWLGRKSKTEEKEKSKRASQRIIPGNLVAGFVTIPHLKLRVKLGKDIDFLSNELSRLLPGCPQLL